MARSGFGLIDKPSMQCDAILLAIGRVVAYLFSFGELWRSIEQSLTDVDDFIRRFEAVYGTTAVPQAS